MPLPLLWQRAAVSTAQIHYAGMVSKQICEWAVVCTCVTSASAPAYFSQSPMTSSTVYAFGPASVTVLPTAPSFLSTLAPCCQRISSSDLMGALYIYTRPTIPDCHLWVTIVYS